jgi:hypothetical protein
MADLVTASSSPTNCSHFIVEGLNDGVMAWSVSTTESELAVPLTVDEELQLRMLLMRKLEQKGITLPEFIGRVVRGEEATNVKSYDLIAPSSGTPSPNTNIGTSYVNILPGLNGQRRVIDFTGATQFQVHLFAAMPGTGPYSVRVVRDSDNAVLFEAQTAAAAEKEVDSGWLSIPVASPMFSGQTPVRVQAKSATSTDDPTFRSMVLLVQ